MAYISLCKYEDMQSPIKEKAEGILEKTGKLGEIFELLALNQDIYNATDTMVQTYLLKETLLPYNTKERIALLISIENGCKMCVDVHKNIAKTLGMRDDQVEEVLQGVDAISCSDEEKKLLNFCIVASGKESYKTQQKDIDAIKEANYSEAQILEAIAITGYFNYINTLSNVFGLGE